MSGNQGNQDYFPFVRLAETSAAEINVLDHPIFRLGKTAHPSRGADPTDGELLYARKDYRTEFRFMSNERLVLEADVHHGYPGIIAMRVLFAVIDEARLLNYSSRRIPITLAKIAAWMGIPRPGGSQVEMILDAMRSLAGLKLRFFNSWYDKSTKTKLSTEHAVLAEQIEIAKREAERKGKEAKSSGAGPEAKKSAEEAQRLYEELSQAYRSATEDPQSKKPKESWDRLVTEWELGEGTTNFVELGQRLFESLSRKYRVGIDREYFVALDLPLAQRLYAYLAKEDGKNAVGTRRPVYRENLMSLAQRLPLAAKHPSKVKQYLVPALEALKSSRGGKQYLRSYSFGGIKQDAYLEVTFAQVDLRAGVRALAAAKLASP
jgi:hypothetical protein